MREERIIGILQELSKRVAGYNVTMRELQDDFDNGRRASMQIRKNAQKCMAMADVTIRRFLAIASRNNIDQEWSICKVFDSRRMKFVELELFFH